jgi:hypothetical protein
MRKLLGAMFLVSTLLAAQATAAEAQPDPPENGGGQWDLADVDLVAVPGQGGPSGTYPGFRGYCAVPYSVNACGGLVVSVTFAGLDAHPRPPDCGPFGCWQNGGLVGRATLHRVFGCSTRSGNRVPAFDRTTTTVVSIARPRFFFFVVPPGGDTMQLEAPSILGYDHPEHCPPGLRPAQWALTFEEVRVALVSDHYPEWTYELGTASWSSDQFQRHKKPPRG